MFCEAVLRNIGHYSDSSAVVDTVYFGGGTPSVLPPEIIAQIINKIRDSFTLADSPEITLEANPNTLTPERLENFLKAGINRLSIGIQSMSDDELTFLGRTHNASRAEKAVLDAVSAGFGNISCDIIMALPGQSAEKLLYSADKISDLPIQHISAYILKIEDGTPFDKSDIRSVMPDDDTVAEMYLSVSELLRKKGFAHYEVSNFAKDGFESRHNCRYWKCLDYIGIGPSAHSCHDGKRFAIEPDLQEFIDSPTQQIYVTDDSPCGFEEYAMLRLRLAEGLRLDDVRSHKKDIEKKITPLLKAGYVKYDGETVTLTEKGFLMSNSVISYLVF